MGAAGQGEPHPGGRGLRAVAACVVLLAVFRSPPRSPSGVLRCCALKTRGSKDLTGIGSTVEGTQSHPVPHGVGVPSWPSVLISTVENCITLLSAHVRDWKTPGCPRPAQEALTHTRHSGLPPGPPACWPLFPQSSPSPDPSPCHRAERLACLPPPRHLAPRELDLQQHPEPTHKERLVFGG